MADTINWDGESGKEYLYYIHPVGTNFVDEPGNYIFTKEVSPGRFRPLYIGETSSLRDRPLGPGHEKWPCATRNGVTHIHAHTSSSSKLARVAEEIDLINRWNPVCND